MKTTHCGDKMKSEAARVLSVCGLCLTVVLAAACSVDTSKLRAPASQDTAPAADRPVGADVADTGGDVPLGRADGPDLATKDAAMDSASPDALPVSVDLPVAAEDSRDGPSGGESGGDGAWDGGQTGIDSEPGDMDSGLDGAGGAGGTGGTAGTGGTDGTGGTGGTGTTGGTGGVRGTGGADSDLVLWYKFDESSGMTAEDSSPLATSASNGTLGVAGMGGSATFTTDCQVGTHALSLTPSSYGYNPGGGYVTVPSPSSLAPDAITIAVWVKLAVATSSQNWERIFDFGNGTGARDPFFYMVARSSETASAPVRVGISDVGHSTSDEQRLESTYGLTARVWHHIAVVLPAGEPYTGTLYIDGVVAATNKAMTVHLSDVGRTTMNWLGRSPYTSDPYFYGSLDDFRIYKRALSAAEITALMAVR